MTRKVLGLAVVAVCAISVVAAANASAAVEFRSNGNKAVTLTGEQHTNNHVFTVGFGSTTCTKAKFEGTANTSPTPSVTLSAAYGAAAGGSCAFAGIPIEMHMNGCDIKLFAAGTENLECPEGKEITLTAIQAGVTKCIVHIPAQTGLTGVTYTNVGAGETEEVTMHIDITNQIKYSQTEGTGLGKCPTSDGQANGSYTGTATVTAEQTASPFAHIGITVS